jgi:hypothetical protein
MLMIPIETEGHDRDVLVLVLGKTNLERLKLADPAEAVLQQCGQQLLNPTVMVCYEEDEAALMQVANRGDLQALIKYLQRGWKFRQELGDHDRGPESIRGSN